MIFDETDDTNTGAMPAAADEAPATDEGMPAEVPADEEETAAPATTDAV
jgi:hypothetical protein